MQINCRPSCLIALARKSSEFLLSSNGNPKIVTRNHHFRGLTCLASDASNRHVLDSELYLQQARWANTSSGSYAPSRMVTESCRPKERRPDLGASASVCEDNETLPPLPVPDFSSTMEKLKESISPMAMNSLEFVSTLELIEEFSGCAGPKLDSLLRRKAKQTKNWLTNDWWEREIYLKSRKPLVINSNPAMIYPSLTFDVDSQQKFIKAASLLISGIIDYKLALIQGYNPEATTSSNEFQLDSNLCYSQYRYIFGTTRLPGDIQDEMVVEDLANSDPHRPMSIILAYRGNFFEIILNEVENEDARIDRLVLALSKILGSQKSGDTSENVLNGLGVLTTGKRSEWAKAFRLLDTDSINAIKDAQFVLSIDTINPESADQHSNHLIMSSSDSSENRAALSRQVLHGDNANIGNRWFDKALQLVLVTDDKAERFIGAGLNYEHTLAEAMVVSKMIEFSYDRMIQKHRQLSSLDLSSKQTYQTSDFELRQLPMFKGSDSRTMNDYLKKARQDYSAQVDQFDLIYMNYKNYGSNAIKSWRFSPDSWFQVALQLSYFNVHRRLGPCYESASTRRFAQGRTETIRGLTKEVAQFCFDPNPDTMRAAIQSHKSYANQANNADAIDRVLLGYRLTFNELRANKWDWGLELGDDDAKSKADSAQLNHLFNEREIAVISAFFQNELIKRSNRFALSTSQVSSIHPNIVMSYGPLLADGYGCCYNITGQRISAAITANSSNQSFCCEANKLHEHLQVSLDMMRNIIEQQ